MTYLLSGSLEFLKQWLAESENVRLAEWLRLSTSCKLSLQALLLALIKGWC